MALLRRHRSASSTVTLAPLTSSPSPTNPACASPSAKPPIYGHLMRNGRARVAVTCSTTTLEEQHWVSGRRLASESHSAALGTSRWR